MKSTKKSLFLSTLSLVLCFAMLLGTTWAWFTDEVTSGVNQIKAGNLDVELYHATSGAVIADDANKVTSTTKLFNIGHWEPGVVVYENFMVKNVGNLALKYQLSMTVGDFNKTVEGNHTLKEVLKVAVVPGGFTGTTRAEAEALTGYTTLKNFSTSSNGALLPGSTGDTFGVVIYWQPTDNDNLYNLNNGKKATVVAGKFAETELGIELGVKLTAQQLAHEADSFDNQYDAGASGTEPTTVLHEKASSKAIAMTGTENTITEIGGESAQGVTDVTVQSTSQIATATVPVSAAQTVMSNLLPGEGVDNSKNREMVLNLNVDTKETTDTSVTYEIGVTADLTYTDNGGTVQQSTTDVHELSEFMTATVKIPSDLDDVTVTHSGNAMEKMTSATATPTNEYGGYYYDSYYGTLTIKSKTFSPFKVSYYLPELTIIWWWPNPKPYQKMDVSNRYYAETDSLQVGQMVPVYSYFTKKDGTNTNWLKVTSSNPDVIKVTWSGAWYDKLYAVGEGTATVTFEDYEQTGLVRKSFTIKVTRETTIDKIDIGAYYSFDEFEFKDASGGSLGIHPIDWVVLDKDVTNNRIYVVSKDILCDMKFNSSNQKTTTFDNSSLKTWLNGDFKNGFGENASKINGDIGLLDYRALPYWDESLADGWGDSAPGTLFGDWDAAKAQHYGVEVMGEGIGSGAVSSAKSPSFWIIGENGVACLGGQGQSYHNNEFLNYILEGTTAGVRPAMWITLPQVAD